MNEKPVVSRSLALIAETAAFLVVIVAICVAFIVFAR
jgi:hypothetical protein